MKTIEPQKRLEASAALGELMMRRHERQLISRFTVVILACTLIGLGLGRSLTPDTAVICIGAGLAGFVAFLGLEAAARRRAAEWADLMREQMEARLTEWVDGNHVVERATGRKLKLHSRLRSVCRF